MEKALSFDYSNFGRDILFEGIQTLMDKLRILNPFLKNSSKAFFEHLPNFRVLRISQKISAK
jgi:hypothetical protein